MKTDTAEMPEWLRVGEREDAVSALEFAVEVSSTLNVTPLNWKWLLIVIHNALQGALVCTLSGSHATGALSEKSMKAVWKWYEDSSTYTKSQHPKEWLAPPLELYERAKQKCYMREFDGSPISTTQDQDDDVKKLNQLRRLFAHYTPCEWSIETEGLPRIVVNVVGVIEELLQHPAFWLRLEPKQECRARQAIAQLRQKFLQSTEARAS